MGKTPYALQLYTVRDQLEADLAGTLGRVRQAGYRLVELAGTQGRSPEEYKDLLDEAGLEAVSAHIGFEEVTTHPQWAMDQARIFGIEYVVVPWLGGEEFNEKAAWLNAAHRMDAAGAALRDEGIRLCYHNHAHEFMSIEGECIHDLLFADTAPENLAVQLDTCWAAVGGKDPAALIRRYSGRIPLVHFKDFKPGMPPSLTEVGNGCLQWDAIIAAVRDAGVACCIVEQDDNFLPGSDGTPDPIESARVSAAFVSQRL